MAANERSNIHNDAYQSDAYNVGGPLGRDLEVTSTLFFAECASVTFDRRGRIVTVCVSPQGATLRMIDPKTLATLASHELPGREPGTFSFSNFSGGGYFYLDHRDRAVVSTFDGHLLTIAERQGGFEVVRDVDLSKVTAGSGIQSALPDWAGRIWFVTVSGVVGYVTPEGAVRNVHLPKGETIANSFSMDESGGVFIVSTHALYRFDLRRGRPRVTWRKTYDRGSRVKPGQVSQGSGTTPTLVGRASSRGGGSIAITDNADPRMNVLVFRRGKAGPGRKPLCRQPVFTAGRSDDENSLISVPGGLVAENNYGYAGPLPADPSGRSATTEPGMVKIAVNYRRGGCHVAWRNTTARIPTVVAKLSRRTGLIYAYTHPSASEVPRRRPCARRALPGGVVLHRLQRAHRQAGLVEVHRQRPGVQQQLRPRQPRPRRHGVRRDAGRADPDSRHPLDGHGQGLDQLLEHTSRSGVVPLAELLGEPRLELDQISPDRPGPPRDHCWV